MVDKLNSHLYYIVDSVWTLDTKHGFEEQGNGPMGASELVANSYPLIDPPLQNLISKVFFAASDMVLASA